ncbi:outer membrane protein [Labrys monachus]|uniref:Outer membrane immunogenic protein n=1 Tax=Labrys monachus TaxID=217067 RepID=A0ABU0FGA6_9HYPH|nr:outer membrane protein [Labrys monachus]MDQ0393164.1 outer membrane immunogenic protein [Labrys monachus]
MKIFALAIAAALSLGSTAALAADLAAPPAEPQAPVVMPYTWTGFYVGAHAGYGWGRERDDQSHLFSQTPPPPPPPDKLDLEGFIGGAHAGYNYQVGPFVLGAEGDIDYAAITASGPFSYNGGTVVGNLRLRTDLQGSARVRAGYAIDKLLIYTTGGVAFANAKLSTNGAGPSNTHVGWTIGGGFEYAFTDNWIGRAEVRYSDFEKKNYETLYGPVKSGWNQTTTELGVSYKF